jgi:hypothetical protein
LCGRTLSTSQHRRPAQCAATQGRATADYSPRLAEGAAPATAAREATGAPAFFVARERLTASAAEGSVVVVHVAAVGALALGRFDRVLRRLRGYLSGAAVAAETRAVL